MKRESKLALGIDIGGTRVKAALVNSQGEIVGSAHTATPSSLAQLEKEMAAMLGDLQLGKPAVSAAGIGCKGIIDSATTQVLTLPGAQHYLEGCRLADLVAGVLPPGCPVTADNDARIALAGEHRWGSARGCRNVFMLTLGTGVGGAILSAGQILRGAGAIAGHIGHLTVDPDGPDCICGNRGCLETIFSASALEGEAFASLRRGLNIELAGERLPAPTCEQLFAAARHGDAVAKRIIERAAKYLGGAIAGLIFVLDPEKVILTGQMIESADMLLDMLSNDVQQRTYGLLRRKVPIVRSSLADPSGVIGAAALALC